MAYRPTLTNICAKSIRIGQLLLKLSLVVGRFHKQFKRFNDCQLPTAHSALKQSVYVYIYSSTHGSLLRNDTIAIISMNSYGTSFHIINKTVLA